ncbi:MAG: hypothetical protein KDI83_08650 [Gammaproteobacteria bacterium]|nr:hypothetical protein [Gammaproteobacteria bacterium]MCP5417774.1 hypothetical protein [Chromatiaceae bacterium]
MRKRSMFVSGLTTAVALSVVLAALPGQVAAFGFGNSGNRQDPGDSAYDRYRNRGPGRHSGFGMGRDGGYPRRDGSAAGNRPDYDATRDGSSGMGMGNRRGYPGGDYGPGPGYGPMGTAPGFGPGYGASGGPEYGNSGTPPQGGGYGAGAPGYRQPSSGYGYRDYPGQGYGYPGYNAPGGWADPAQGADPAPNQPGMPGQGWGMPRYGTPGYGPSTPGSSGFGMGR